MAWHWLQITGAVAASVAICWLAAQYVLHLRLLNVQTGSMRPTFRPGDALVMQWTAAPQLRVGMVVSYHSPRNPNELVTHRVAKLFPATHSFQTKGDVLTTPDPVTRDSLLAGRITAILPGMGRALTWLGSWWGLAVCVYAPAIAIGAGELYRLERHYARRFYRLQQT